ncbi:YcnI family protein [Kitasatospora sp. NBC_01250]|uniref:YcnI family copper-binding membrane protein n=1 Tax=Kitasatospora sp. NBC_01250 TaxID=2903571 RepID=UPI002E379198|nr:YcnI family protein [Kitasatospora sp. NBC_01250]
MTVTLKRRLAAATALAGAAVLLIAGPASAHVTVQPSSVAKDATDQTFAFRVPDEDDTASTVRVEVDFPLDHPIPSALVAPVPGWTDQIQTTKLATPIHTDDGDITDVVSQIVWTGGQIAPNHYQDFTVDFGALPDNTDQVVFKALQTYSNGNIVRWIDEQKPGQPEPDHPAPVLYLTSAPASSAPSAPSTAAKSSSDATARGLGIAGIVVGVLGAVAGAVLGRRGRGADGSGTSA